MWLSHIKKIFILKESIMAVFEKVQEIIVEELGKEPSEVTLESTFDDLEADSLDLFQVISEGLTTVGDLVAYVEEKTK